MEMTNKINNQPTIPLPSEFPRVLAALMAGLIKEVAYCVENGFGELALEPFARYASGHIQCNECPFQNHCRAASVYDNDPSAYHCYRHLCAQLDVKPMSQNDFDEYVKEGIFE